jgi:hypothetical protein
MKYVWLIWSGAFLLPYAQLVRFFGGVCRTDGHDHLRWR